MAQPRVSILMLTYNRPQKIGGAIRSVLGQTFTDWELVIVQDGSNQETIELLKAWLEKEPRIRYFARGKVGSIADASNYGIEQARGEYVALLDDDDAWSDPNKLAMQVDFLDRNPEYAACGGGYVIVDQDGRELGRFLKPEHDAQIRSRALLANPLVNCASIFRRTINGELSLYDATLPGFADWDFWLMLGAKGKLYNFPLYVANYSLWPGGGSFQAIRTNARSALTVVLKHRRNYKGFWLALLMAWGYICYSRLPRRILQFSYRKLSMLKKGWSAGDHPASGVGSRAATIGRAQ